MKLWLISQTARSGYDTFDSAVVAAETEGDARLITPDGGTWEKQRSVPKNWQAWAETPEQVRVVCIGEAAPDVERGVVLASFNAG